MAVYFASDVHLGLRFQSQDPRLIEQRFVGWLRSIEHDCEKLFLVGDIFDFWFEWRGVVPKGFTRLLGQLAAMADRGVEINIFAGNHDLWLREYFTKEFGAKIYFEPQSFEIQGRKLFIAHGDNLGRRPLINRLLGGVFRSTIAHWFFSRLLHPDTAMRFGKWWSSKNRHARSGVAHDFGDETEYVVQFARQSESYDYFIFGHLHTPIIYPLNPESSVVVLGEWIVNPFYARMEGGVITLIKYND